MQNKLFIAPLFYATISLGGSIPPELASTSISVAKFLDQVAKPLKGKTLMGQSCEVTNGALAIYAKDTLFCKTPRELIEMLVVNIPSDILAYHMFSYLAEQSSTTPTSLTDFVEYIIKVANSEQPSLAYQLKQNVAGVDQDLASHIPTIEGNLLKNLLLIVFVATVNQRFIRPIIRHCYRLIIPPKKAD